MRIQTKLFLILLLNMTLVIALFKYHHVNQENFYNLLIEHGLNQTTNGVSDTKVKLDITEFKKQKNELELEVYATLFMLLLFMVLLFTMLTNFLTKPIKKILNHMELWTKIEDENILNKKDEFAQLAKSFNKTYDKQMKITKELNEQISIIHTVLNSTKDFIYYKNYQTQNGNFIGCNNSFAEFLGKKPEEVINHNDIDIFGAEVASFFRDIDKSVLQEKKAIANKYWIVSPTGSRVYTNTLKAPIFNKDGSILGIVGIARDITEELLYQSNLEHLNKTLERRVEEEVDKNRVKDKKFMEQSRLAQMGEMLSMIAHQWRQPLNSISLTSSNLLFKIMMDDVDKELFENEIKLIDEYSQHLSKTIDDFRGFFKENKNKERTSLKAIVKDVLNMIQTSLENKNIRIVTSYRCELIFETYTSEVKQVVLNIIKNAEDILLEKNVENPVIIIEILCIPDCQNQTLVIKDNAGGVPEDIIDKIFDPYFSTKLEKDGTGLGLYMSRTIIEEHCGGRLSVSNDESGAVFMIEFKNE
jgi:PAS domain S-box-containing protein